MYARLSKLVKCCIIVSCVIGVSLFMVCKGAGATDREGDETLSLGDYFLHYLLPIENDLTIVQVFETIPESEYIHKGESLPIPDVYVSEREIYEVVSNLS